MEACGKVQTLIHSAISEDLSQDLRGYKNITGKVEGSVKKHKTKPNSMSDIFV